MIDRLRTFASRKQSLDYLSRELERIDSEMTRIGSALKDTTPVSGGENKSEERLVNLIMQKAELEQIRNETESWLFDMQKALSELNEDDYHIIDVLYLQQLPGAYDKLCEDFGLFDRTTIYRRRNRIIRHLTLTFYGVTER